MDSKQTQPMVVIAGATGDLGFRIAKVLAASDAEAPRYLRISGNQISPRGLVELLTGMEGRRWKLLRAGNIGGLSVIIAVVRAFASAINAPFPAWQGMHYLRDMSAGRAKLHGLGNARYGTANWSGAAAVLTPSL